MVNNYYCCPCCLKGNLIKQCDVLICSNCNSRYYIKSESPIFLQNINKNIKETIELYKTVHTKFVSQHMGRFIKFMNMGMPKKVDEEDTLMVKNALINKNSIRLFQNLIGDNNLDGKDVLELGCGRCGNLELINSLFKVSSLYGIDLSIDGYASMNLINKSNIHLCISDLNSILPFYNDCFDFILCIEVIHNVENRINLLKESYRVMRSGQFCIADALDCSLWDYLISAAKHIGYRVQGNIDITNSVLQSIDEITSNRVSIFGEENINMIGVKGSKLYDDIYNKNKEYRLLTLCKY